MPTIVSRDKPRAVAAYFFGGMIHSSHYDENSEMTHREMTHRYRNELSNLFQGTRLFTVLTVVIALAGSSQAQDRHYFSKGNAPPGLIAQQKLMENPSLAAHSQAVEIIAPQGALLSFWSGKGYSAAHDSTLNVGLTIGQVYRLKVTNIPRLNGHEVYPSVEVIDRLHPPEGMENQFPIQIVLTFDDLEKALRGQLVTKVIYLEDPKMSLPYRRVANDQPSFDIGRAEDPLRTAERLGRPMAIVRIGSRVPTFDDMSHQGDFDFYSQPPAELPPLQPILPSTDTAVPEVGKLNPRTPKRDMPPIVTGGAYGTKLNIGR